jgi:hypothetical protein
VRFAGPEVKKIQRPLSNTAIWLMDNFLMERADAAVREAKNYEQPHRWNRQSEGGR